MILRVLNLKTRFPEMDFGFLIVFLAGFYLVYWKVIFDMSPV